jgi:FkbH-like protein
MDQGDVERFIAHPRDPGLLKWARAQAREGDPRAVLRALRRLVSPDLDYTTASGLGRLFEQLRAKIVQDAKIAQDGSEEGASRIRVAFLGNYTVYPLVGLLKLYLAAAGIAAEVHHPDYGTWRQELIDPTSDFHAEPHDFTIVSTLWSDVAHLPSPGDDRAAADAAIAAEIATWAGFWQAAQPQGGQIVQDNFVAPANRPFGNLDGRLAGGIARYASRLNDALQDAAPPYVTLHDLASLAAEQGRRRWSDPRFFYEAKLPCAPEMLPLYAHSLAQTLLAQLGVGHKCLVLDLDNTLWGGVIGDDGLGGIAIGQGDARGEAHLAFQHYALQLKARGVLLAVCSKNTDAIAREPFEKHDGMAIRLGDIACFVANWDDKATNLRRIAAELNIGLNSLVFVDDNPVERSIVRQLVPEVAVPELPEDPAGYIEALDRMRYFETPSINREDLQRTSMMQAEAARQAVVASSGADLDSFLQSLALVATIAPVDANNLDRTVQLINRSNQFNVTTRRYSSADLLAKLDDPDWILRTVSLRDRFGDNGLIAVLIAHVDAQAGLLEIDSWLMSCRVLKRGVEDASLNHLVALARDKGLAALRGAYIPTEKNGLVRDLFASLGFTEEAGEPDGRTTWRLDVAHAVPRAHQIEIVEK